MPFIATDEESCNVVIQKLLKFADNNFGIEAIDIHAWFQSAVCLEECEVAPVASVSRPRVPDPPRRAPVLRRISDTKQRWIIRRIRRGIIGIESWTMFEEDYLVNQIDQTWSICPDEAQIEIKENGRSSLS